jgi:hypothetical protein
LQQIAVVKTSKMTRLVAGLLGLAAAPGCGPASAPLSASPDGASGDEDGAAADPCVAANGGPMRATTFSCALPQPCEAVVYDGADGPGLRPPAPSINLPAAQCVLQHLRDAVSSHLTIERPNIVGFDTTHLWVQRDGSVIYERSWMYDLGGEHIGPRRLRAKPKAFFDACLLETDPKTVHDCLTTWWVAGACFAAGSLPCMP